MNRTCTQCGTQLQPDQGFCAECGTAWTAPADTTATQAAAQPPAQQYAAVTPPPAAPADGTNKVMLFSVIAILVLAVLGGGGWLLARDRSAKAAALAPPVAGSAPSIASPAAQPAPGAADPAAAANSAAAALGTTSTEGSAAAAASKNCSLVTPAEIEQILGRKVVNVTTSDVWCSYFTDDTRSVDIDSTWTGGKEAMTAAKSVNANPGLFEPVAGIGDEAYMQVAGVLNVLKGDVYFTINARQYPDQDKIEAAIARKALEKLH